MNINDAVNFFLKSDGKIDTTKCCYAHLSTNKYHVYYSVILNQYYWCTSLQEALYCFKNNIAEQPKCIYCRKNPISYRPAEKKYCKYCSPYCQGKDKNFYASDEFKFKASRTKLEKYGCEHFNNVEKYKSTCLEKYGVENYFSTVECKKKIKSTCLEKYGVENCSQLEESKNKAKITCLKKYNRFNHNQQHITEHSLELLNNKDWLIDQHYNKRKPILYIAKILGVSDITIANYFNKHNIDIVVTMSSVGEQEVFNFLLSLNQNFNIIRRDRKLLFGKELDIYLPDHKLAIEFNGDFWHTISLKNNISANKHRDKFFACEKQGIQLLQIRESDWINKKEIWKSYLAGKLGYFNTKIHARKCEIKTVSYSETKKFLDQNHLQGSTTSKLNYGLYFEDELVMIQTYKRTKEGYELLRAASKLHTNIRGGFSKLFKYFLRENNPTKVITFADLEYSVGSVYKTLGFEYFHRSNPSYYYFKDGKYYHKRGFQKKKHNIPDSITEQQYWLERGYSIYPTCGTSCFIWVKQ